MPYDTKHTFEETTQEHAVRLKQSERWTKIRRRALLLKLDGLAQDEVQARMGLTNCPDHVARASIDDLSVLAVERFDRAPAVGPQAMESFFSVYATGQQQERTMTDAEVEGVGLMLLKLSEIADIDPAAARL